MMILDEVFGIHGHGTMNLKGLSSLGFILWEHYLFNITMAIHPTIAELFQSGRGSGGLTNQPALPSKSPLLECLKTNFKWLFKAHHESGTA